MTDAEAFDLFRQGAILLGFPGGVLACLVTQQLARDFREWRRSVRLDRQLAGLRARCPLDEECVAGRGHQGPCDPQEYE